MRQWYKTALKWVSVAASLASMAAGGVVASAATTDSVGENTNEHGAADTSVNAIGGIVEKDTSAVEGNSSVSIRSAKTASADNGVSAKNAGMTTANGATAKKSTCTLGVSTFAQCFPDPVLAQQMVWLAGGEDTGTVFDQGMESGITSFIYDGDVDGTPIKSLAGMENLHHMADLELPNNEISDISPLKNVTSELNKTLSKDDKPKVLSIDLRNNKITDMSPLTSITWAEDVNLMDNRIAAVPAGMSKLVHLASLNLNGNLLSDLSPLSGIASLSDLEAVDNIGITSIRGLKDLPQLKTLYLDRDYSLNDLSGIGAFSSLQSLSLRCGQRFGTVIDPNSQVGSLTDLSPLADAKSLTTLDIGKQPVYDLTPLSGLPNLQTLDAEYDGITDLIPLSSIDTLTSVDVLHQTYANPTPLNPKKENNWSVRMPSAVLPDKSHMAPTSMVATDSAGTATKGTYDAKTGEAVWADPELDGSAAIGFDGTATLPAVKTDAGTGKGTDKGKGGNASGTSNKGADGSATGSSDKGKDGDPDGNSDGSDPNPVRTKDISFEFSGTITEPYTKVVKHTVTFDSNGGTTVAAQSVRDGDVAQKPKNPTNGAKVFVGWYTAAGTAYDFATPVTTDGMILTAKWQTKYTVTFNLNYSGAPAGPASQSVAPNGKVTKPADPKRTGWVFKGWSTKASGGTIYVFSTKVTKNTTLYAQWERPLVSALPMTGGDGANILGPFAVIVLFVGIAVALGKLLDRRRNM